MQFDADAILFDIDGTLVDSTAAVERTWRTWAATRGLDAEAILRVCHGRRSVDTIARFLPAEQVETAVGEVERLELSDLGGVIALPAAQTLLAAIPAGRWAAVTSGPQVLMRARLTAAGLPLPAVLISADDVTAGKPDPEGYRKAAVELGFGVGRCVVIEDAPIGIEAGRSAGARVLAVATSHSRAELTSAHAVIDDLTACRVDYAGETLTVTTTP